MLPFRCNKIKTKDCKPELDRPPLIALARRQQAHGGEALLRDGGRLKSGLVRSRCRGGLDLAWRHERQMQSKDGADLEITAAKSEKGDLERDKEEEMKERTAHASLCQGKQLPRQHGEAEMLASNQPPHVDRGRRLLGPAVLRT